MQPGGVMMAKPDMQAGAADTGLDLGLDVELADLPAEVRWREWMGRVEAAIFASAEPAPRAALARLVGKSCVLDDLIADIRDELKGRPYDLVFVAGGWQHRTRPRFAEAVRAAADSSGRMEAPDLTRLEMLALAAVAYRQPVTRAAMSEALGRDISRDVLARLKRLGLIGGGPRAPFPGAPLTYVTTQAFLSAFGLATLRDLPEIQGIGEAVGGEAEDGERDPPDGVAGSPPAVGTDIWPDAAAAEELEPASMRFED
jgi:segregation and condensation protein B